jgi:glucose-1-phosphate thymidylyltransferase
VFKVKNAVVLAGGKGIRLQALAEDVPKPMMIVGGKPILEHVVTMLKRLGFEKVFIVVGYKKELIQQYFGSGEKFGLKITYLENTFIDDKIKCGLSDAVLLLEGRIFEPFLTILGDEIYIDTKHGGMIREFEDRPESCECMVAVSKTDDVEAIKKNYTVDIDTHWRVVDLVEKPEKPFNNLIGCGTYIFKPSIFPYIRMTKVSARSGRKELADTMKAMVKDGKTVKAFTIGGKYVNINYPQDLIKAENYLREQKNGK